MRICVANGNQLVRRTIKDFLEALGHTVVPVPENHGLLGVLQASGDRPGLIIAECRRAEATPSAAAVLQQVHKLAPETPIIALIDPGTVPSPKEAISSGIYAFLHKPLHLTELELMLIRLSENGTHSGAHAAPAPPETTPGWH